MSEKKHCTNLACQWHDQKEGCELFPGDWGFLECRQHQTETKPTKPTKTRKAK